MTGCKSTLSRKTRRKANEKHQNQKGNRTTSMTITSSTDINTCRNCGRTGHWAKDCWRPGGDAYDKSTKNNSNTQKKGRVTRKANGKANMWTLLKRISLLRQPQPCRILHKHRVQNVEPWTMGVTINSVSTRRQAGAEHSLLDSGAQLHACRIKYPGQKVPLPDSGIHTASGARLQHDGGRLVTYKLPEGRTIRVLFHVCSSETNSVSLALPIKSGWNSTV